MFTESATSAYLIPRPDGSSYLQPVCADAQHELHALVEQYALCKPAESAAAVARVNSIQPGDALRIARYLHGQLKWQVDAEAGVTPSPLPSDIIDACELDAAANAAPFESLCQRERGRLASGIDIGFSYEGPGAVELVARLNELYGIEP